MDIRPSTYGNNRQVPIAGGDTRARDDPGAFRESDTRPCSGGLARITAGARPYPIADRGGIALITASSLRNAVQPVPHPPVTNIDVWSNTQLTPEHERNALSELLKLAPSPDLRLVMPFKVPENDVPPPRLDDDRIGNRYIIELAEKWGLPIAPAGDGGTPVLNVDGESVNIAIQPESEDPNLAGAAAHYIDSDATIVLNKNGLDELGECRAEFLSELYEFDEPSDDEMNTALSAFDEVVAAKIASTLIHEACHAKQHAALEHNPGSYALWDSILEHAAYTQESSALEMWYQTKQSKLDDQGIDMLGNDVGSTLLVSLFNSAHTFQRYYGKRLTSEIQSLTIGRQEPLTAKTICDEIISIDVNSLKRKYGAMQQSGRPQNPVVFSTIRSILFKPALGNLVFPPLFIFKPQRLIFA